MKYIIAILLVLVSSVGYAADDNKYLHSNVPHAISGGITDDANQEFKFLRTDTNGYLKATLGTALNNANDSIAVYPPAPSMYHIATASSFQIKSAAGYLFSMVINTGSAGSATIYDNTACSTTTIAVVNTAAQVNLNYNGLFNTGLCITTTGVADITVVWK